MHLRWDATFFTEKDGDKVLLPLNIVSAYHRRVSVPYLEDSGGGSALVKRAAT